jgi:hypothetical protein
MSSGHDGHESHGHSESHSEAKTKDKTSMVDETIDRLAKRIENYITGGISKLIAAILFLITIGAVYGYLAASRGEPIAEYFIIAPAIAGLLAYYNRSFAVILFILLVVVLLLVPL